MKAIFLLVINFAFLHLNGQSIQFKDLSNLVGTSKLVCSEYLTSRNISYKETRLEYRIENYEYSNENWLTIVDVFYNFQDSVYKVELYFIDDADKNFVTLERNIKLNCKKARYFRNDFYYTEYLYKNRYIYITRGKWKSTISGKAMGSIIVSSEKLFQ